MTSKINKKLLVIATFLIIVVAALVLTNTDRIAVWGAPQKQAAQTRSEAAEKADELFWQTFHQGEYERIPQALDVLTAAYLKTPTDAVTAAHIAWLHNWRSAERLRMDEVPATITDDIHLARRYFEEAVALNPSDARTLGFLGGHLVAEGTLQQDEKLTRQGYFMLLDAIEAWPEFNLFTAGYVMSRLPADSPRFREGLEWQWRNLDECIQQAEANVELFNAPAQSPNEVPNLPIMINSEFACMACHQQLTGELFYSGVLLFSDESAKEPH